MPLQKIANGLTLLFFLFLMGCSTVPKVNSSVELVNHQDPYENWNRKVFSFNEVVDAFALKPIAKSYRFITPKFVRQGVTNFFSNLGEVSNFANNLLQFKPLAAGKDLTRFAVNSTLGVVGLFEVSTPWFNLQPSHEDFGQTLNTWGLPEGSYVVVPFLGGQTLSHSISLPIDYYYLNPVSYLIERKEISWGLTGLQVVQLREGLLDAEQLIQGDRYSFIRDAYLQHRTFLVNDGRLESDPFLEDDDFEFDEADFAD
ncbi:MAG TPA: VacJ family lipoprotein [Marinospirillum sp.]|uniref:MlaA family lipoprotein n=1 Tax=Marinospirillum sp. TaxID=2183934 RepID=UPI002B4A0E85|nr:VacJ family lipoprotein [Marinospirillum sp.]HKM15158.1 VacJ family lipoprotein [Marinospirillum sp.]